ncbi:DNA replication/repair protein RecF [Rubritalea tangerina]|uniref:DNA replication and repair protein RecF n=1 Tax=Rubritalea tangerina TaxID=430798 RepID=A0ABW4Z8A1_9BACT
MIKSLRLIDFRCFATLSMELRDRGGIFIGDNAQGKTSILEAICVLLRLQSPRAKSMRPLVRFEATGAGVAGECWEQELTIRYGRGGVQLGIDGEEVSTQNQYLAQSGLIVWMGNEDIELVRGSGGIRRHYLDFLCSQLDLGYRRALSRYRRALKARNVLLKDPVSREAELDAYTEILIEHGDYLHEVRQRIVAMLEPRASEAQSNISGRDEILSLQYVAGSEGGMREALAVSRESERRQRQTLVGPHRDDVKIFIHGMPASEFASEGQQRTIALALKLAQGEAIEADAGKVPIYLLDDIFGELDPSRRNALMAHLPVGAQKFITTTSVDWLDGGWGEWPLYRVCDGKVSKWERDNSVE